MLKDEVYFQRVFIENGALTWSNGYGLDPIALYDWMKGAGSLRRSCRAWNSQAADCGPYRYCKSSMFVRTYGHLAPY